MIDITAFPKNRWLTVLLATLFLIASSIFVGLVLGLLILRMYAVSFLHYSGIHLPTLYSEIRLGLDRYATQTERYQNGQDPAVYTFLILGTDELDSRAQDVILTDTMLLVSISPAHGQVNMISLPRDLWNYDHASKINGLYYLGLLTQESSSGGIDSSIDSTTDKNVQISSSLTYQDKTEFVTNEIAGMIGVPIDYTLVLSLEAVAEIIGIVGPIDVLVEESFTDYKFPRQGVDLNSTDPEVLYMTISFEEGIERMDSERALQYIRSRMSEGNQGTDTARTLRQQLVVQSLMNTLTSIETISNPKKMAQLYRWYMSYFGNSLPLSHSISLALQVLPQIDSLVFSQSVLPVYPDDEDGVILHPNPIGYNNMWVYTIREIEPFQTYIKEKLAL